MELYLYLNRTFAKECLHKRFDNHHAPEPFSHGISQQTEDSSGESSRLIGKMMGAAREYIPREEE
jgi:hypothetical protein